MSRFFINRYDISNDRVELSGEDVNHVRNVLRLKSGDGITLCDGLGKDYTAVIDRFEAGKAVVSIINSFENKSEPPIDIILFQGIPKSDKMDLIIQKSVELGVKSIVPVVTERTVVKIENSGDAARKAARWQRISFEAAKQCDRGIIPQIGFPVGFGQALEMLKESDVSFISYENEKEFSFKSYLGNNRAINMKNISVLVGPEGGFSSEEADNAVLSGIKPVSLGPRILRTETAGIAVLSIIMYELGDMG